jgi:PGF-CTERM protein
MKRIVLISVLALSLILVFSLPSMAQETANVTTSNATTTAVANTTTAVASTTNATTTAAGVTSFLQAANNTTAPPVPGFEAIFAVAGLLCIALILKRKWSN